MFHFYGEWMRVTGEMQKLHKSFRSAVQEHVYKELKKCPMMDISIAMYDHSNDKYGTGVKSYEWLLDQVGRLMCKDRAEHN